MSTTPQQTQKILDPATPVAAATPEAFKLQAVVSNKLDLTKANQFVAKQIASHAPRMSASIYTKQKNNSPRQLWCYDESNPRIKYLSNKITYKTLKRNAKRYSKELRNYYKTSGELLTEHTVKPEDTLRNLSRMLVSTDALWIEIYLLNQNKISNWDSLDHGIKLKIPNSNTLPVSCSRSLASQ